MVFLESDNLNVENLIGNKPQADDEIVISSYLADCMIYMGCMAKDTNDNEIVINECTLSMITNGEYGSSYDQNKNKYDSKEEFLIQYLKDNGIIEKKIKTAVNKGELATSEDNYGEYKIIGVVLDENEDTYSSRIYYSKNVVEPLISGIVHCTELTRKVNTLEEMETILKYYPVDGSDELSDSEYAEVAVEAATITYLVQFVARYGVIFFLVFSAIILMSFINSSIKFRKKEIGTLRALGCRSKDIITMFLYESVILMLNALAISFVIIPKIINVINSFIIKELLMNINVLRFETTQILEITGIMLVIVILANVIPVRKITKMKPIDAILNK